MKISDLELQLRDTQWIGGQTVVTNTVQGVLLGAPPRAPARPPVASSLQAEHSETLAAGTVIKSATVQVTAKPAGRQEISTVAQVRAATGEPDSASNQLIIDFQSLRTVSKVVPPTADPTMTITPWIGTEFAGRDWDGKAEIQTERLLLAFANSITPATLATGFVHLPSPPADLELTVGGRQAWSFRGPVAKDSAGWTDYQIDVDITAVLQQVLDEATTGDVVVPIILTARTPGVLDVTTQTLNAFGTHVVTFPEGLARTVTTSEEGARSLDLSLPEAASGWELHALHLTLRGTPPATRTLPPTGPDTSGDAELTLTPERSAAIRLGTDSVLTNFSRLHGVRLWLTTDQEAELSAVLHHDAGGKPGDPLDVGTLGPITVPATETPTWMTLPLATPMSLDGHDLWMVIHTNRGRIHTPVVSVDTDPSLHIGLPSGPFRPLPTIAGSPAQSFDAVLRVIGEAPDRAPLPAVTLEVGHSDTASPVGVSLALSDQGTGVRLELPKWRRVGALTLTLTLFAALTLSVENVRVIYRPVEPT